MKNILTLFLTLSLSPILNAQEGLKFRVYLKDKGSNVQLLSNPQAFLSKSAIERRALQGIPINKTDLAIAPEYRKALQELGAQFLAQSKWLNYVYISHPNPELIRALPFVKRIEFPKAHSAGIASIEQQGDTLEYGYARGQLQMLNGHLLHQRGCTGKGVNIAIIDAGFEGFMQATMFDSLRNSGRLLGAYNFITKNSNVFSGWGDHGTGVISTMAANVPDTFVGAAPHANYWLFTTENIHHERPIEMDHWVMAAEFADSVGVQVINSSVAYRTFDDAQFNISYSDLDGNITIITKAADIAANKGILVVAAAGNTGTSADPYILSPGDGDSVLTVGGVNWQGLFDQASSIGPTADGRIKPDVLAQSAPATIVNGLGQVDIEFGTSFAAPVVAGLGACLIEAYPSRHSEEIAGFIRRSAHLYTSPNDSMGYGIPNFDTAFSLATPQYLVQKDSYQIYPNPVEDYLILDTKARKDWRCTLRIYNMQGTLLHTIKIEAFKSKRIALNLNPGLYILVLDGDLNGTHRIQKL